ncbi:MAG: sulfatase-like hydrolase/transferase [Xanthomonadales bacterium]|nr:sulfatase-like hydrolase/transferase [Xanthomonadales bacterium]
MHKPILIVRDALIALCMASALVSCTDKQASGPQADRQPNVIVILADDIGVETVGAFGSEYPTPNIDAIASGGMRFDDAHATPICTPSRVRLLTGRYNFKNYVDFALLPPGETTLAHHFHAAGYRTLVSGKWQLAGTGDADDPLGTTPEAAGFDEHLVWYMQRKDKGSRYWGPKLFDNGVERQYPEQDFGPTIVNQRVLDFITRDDERPFFIYYSMMLAHKPWVTTPITPTAEGNKPRFAGMMAYMDEMVGRVLGTLRDEGLEQDTLVVFIGDNGTHPDITSLRNGKPVRGGKWYTHDAATHVPMAVRWPAAVAAGGSSDQLTDIMDIFPTVLEAAGIAVPGIADGFSLVPVLTSGAASGREWVFIKFDPHADYDESLSTRSRFIFNHERKVYGDGRCYDLGADFLEQHPTDAAASSGCRDLNTIMTGLNSGPFFHKQPGPGLPEH